MFPASAQPPVTRPRGLATVLLTMPVAVAGGLGAGLAPHAALVVVGATVSVVVLALRIEWAALVVIISAVFEGYLDTVSPWAAPWLAAVLVAGWLVRRARGPLHPHRPPVLTVASAVLLVVVALSFIARPHGLPGLLVCVRYAATVGVMLVLADCLGGPLAPRRAARAYVLSCLVAAVWALVSAVLSDSQGTFGPVDGAGSLAFFLVAALPLVGTVRGRPSQPVWWVWGSLLTLMAAGLDTRSLPALLALVAMVVVAVPTGLLRVRHAGVVLALLATSMALVVALEPVPTGQALTDAQRSAHRTLRQQDEVRNAALTMVRESPALGMGPGAFRLLHQDHLASERGATRPVRTADSTVLEVSAELGILGLLALYAVWVLPIVGALRRWRRDRSGLTAATVLAMVGLVSASFVEARQLALPVWFLAAMAHAQSRQASPRAPIVAGPHRARTSGQVAPRW